MRHAESDLRRGIGSARLAQLLQLALGCSFCGGSPSRSASFQMHCSIAMAYSCIDVDNPCRLHNGIAIIVAMLANVENNN